MTIWKVSLISGLTTIAVVVLVSVVAMLFHRGAGHGAHGFGGGVMHAHRMRAMMFSGRHGEACTHLSVDSVNDHAEVATLWVERRLDLDDTQRLALTPVIDAAADFAKELAPLCDVPHDGAKATVALAAKAAAITAGAAERFNGAFLDFYDSLDESQRVQLDAMATHHRGGGAHRGAGLDR